MVTVFNFVQLENACPAIFVKLDGKVMLSKLEQLWNKYSPSILSRLFGNVILIRPVQFWNIFPKVVFMPSARIIWLALCGIYL